MKKLISLILAVAMLLSLGSMSAFAASTNILFSGSGDLPKKGLTDDGADFDTEWDFEDFTWNSIDETKEYPDTISEPVWWVEKGKEDKTSVVNTERGRSLKLSNGDPGLYLLFGKLIKTGTLHATFYMKQDSGTTSQGLLLGLTTGYYDNLAVKKGGEQGDLLQIKDGTTATVKTGANPLTNGSWTTFSNNFASETWHRIDYVVTDNATNADGLDVYIDGVKITSKGQIPLTQITYSGVSVQNPGVKGLRFGRWAVNIPTTYLDDVRVRRYSGTKGLTLESESTTFDENRSAKITFTDMVDATKLTKENVKIKRKRGGAMITDFEITDATSTGMTITLDENCYDNEYTIDLADTVKGLVTGNTATEIKITKTSGTGVPLVIAESFYDVDGKAVTNEGTSFLSYVDVTFDNPVDFDTAQEKISYVDENDIPAQDITFVQRSDNVVRMQLTKFVDPKKTYRIKVADGLWNKDKTVASDGVYYGYAYKTINDAGIKKASHTIADGKHSYTFWKNDNLAYNIYVIAAKYENGTNKLLDVSFNPVTIGASEKGTFTKSYTCNFENGTDVRYYIWDQGTLKPTVFVD